MGGSISNCLPTLPSLWLSFSFFVVVHFSLLIASTTATVYDGEDGGINTVSVVTSSSSSDNSFFPPLAPPPQSQPTYKSKASPFRPSIAVIVGVLTTVFSVTFLLLLYAKHCRRGDSLNPFSTRGYPPATARKNSGIERAVIDSLPIFRFASLRGQKDGLECAVCLNRFESTEVLRLLPKCKHAFHVECVDTWLDAHSTCPLCRYRVDPEDILLVEDNRILYQSSGETPSRSSSATQQHPTPDLGTAVSRVSGRHSFAGNSLEVIVETPRAVVQRRSLDSWNSRKKKRNSKSSGETVDVGCFDRPRKDELLLADNKTTKGKDVAAEQRRLEHRIIISGDTERDGPHHRWSDVQPSDLLFLQSEMILSDSHRFSGSRPFRPSTSTRIGGGEGSSSHNHNSRSGRNVIINGRSVSEITGLSRFRSNEESDGDGDGGDGDGDGEEEVVHDGERQEQRKRRRNWKQQRQREEHRKRQEGAVSRWMAWISQPHFQGQQSQQPAVHGTTSAAAASSSSPSSVVVV